MILFINLLVFLGLVIVSLDHFLFEGSFVAMLPNSPRQLIWFNIIFFLPHVFFGHIIVLFEPGYFKNFRGYYFFCIFLTLASLVFLRPYIGVKLYHWLYLSVTHTHLVQQQLGLASIGLSRVGWSYKALRVVTTVAISFGTWMFFFDPTLHSFFAGRIAGVCLGLFLLGALFSLSIIAFSGEKGKLGFYYGWSCFPLTASLVIFHAFGGTFVWVFFSRIVHDLTAWTIYIVHYKNRVHKGLGLPILARFFAKRWWVVIAIPLISMVIAFPFAMAEEGTNLWIIASVLMMTHFLVEHKIWKKGQPTRRYLAFKS